MKTPLTMFALGLVLIMLVPALGVALVNESVIVSDSEGNRRFMAAPLKCTVDASEERRNGLDPNAQIVLAATICPVVRVINGTALDLVFDR